MKPMPIARPLLIATSLAAAPFALAAQDAWLPTPGEYQIDSVATMRFTDPTGTIEKVQKTDGATGTVTVTTKGSHIKKPQVQTYPGKGPVRYCQTAYANVPGPCGGTLNTTVDSATTSMQCQGYQQDLGFKKLGPGVWEKRLRVVPTGAPTQLPPQTVAAMAPVVAKMEARIKVAPPEEAAALRQQIAAIKGGGSIVPGPVSESVQTWRLVSLQCSKPQ